MGSLESEREEGGGGTDEGPRHQVTLARPLAVGQFLVTRGQFAAFARATGYRSGDCQHWDGNHFQPRPGLRWDTFPGQDDRHPVVCLNWDDVHAYVRWLSARTGKPYRLLSEAEAEYAARGGVAGPRYWTGTHATVCQHANVADLATPAAEPAVTDVAPCRDGWPRTSPVGRFPPNPFGLYDVLGNALSWTEECYQGAYDGAPTDGSSRSTGCTKPAGDWKVLRGAAWSNPPQILRATGRDVEHPQSRGDAFGLRVARGA